MRLPLFLQSAPLKGCASQSMRMPSDSVQLSVRRFPFFSTVRRLIRGGGTVTRYTGSMPPPRACARGEYRSEQAAQCGPPQQGRSRYFSSARGAPAAVFETDGRGTASTPHWNGNADPSPRSHAPLPVPEAYSGRALPPLYGSGDNYLHASSPIGALPAAQPCSNRRLSPHSEEADCASPSCVPCGPPPSQPPSGVRAWPCTHPGPPVQSRTSAYPSRSVPPYAHSDADPSVYGLSNRSGFSSPAPHGAGEAQRNNWDRTSFSRRSPSGQSLSRGGYSSNVMGSNLVEPRWEEERLAPIQKNFYVEHPAVASRSSEEVSAFFRANHLRVDGEAPLPKPVLSFEEAGFPSAIVKQLHKMHFAEPTPIQKIGWPVALSGRDMVGIAQTGSGKTLGFLLPGLVHARAQPALKPGDGPVVLVLAPTRELAMQIRHECVKFTDGLSLELQEKAPLGESTPPLRREFRTACVYGGVPRHAQASELTRGAEVLVATPGRLLDFLDLGTTNLKRVSYVVLDEADRMMDMGFEPQVRKIFSQIRPDRQTLLWSATWPREVRGLAGTFCRSQVVKLQVGSAELQANANVTQRVEVVSSGQLQQRLFSVLEELAGRKTLVFCETKRQCDQLCRELRYRRLRALAIHGDKEQRERDRILHDFRTGHCDILIATDVASRGLDIHDIQFVINYDVPKNIESYIHRIGRTGRGGSTGTAISFFQYDFFAPEKVNMAKKICEAMRSVGQDPPEELQRIECRTAA
ncbi:ethylene-responsive rna helicase [Cystoisospora suis]|uniref:RNA helicase n=1 Tax=Cystoisospora suis TaxID=483139 RepID=A0A2C6L319_9APIC|nr:ethylene-responsive rna helicase [Cystoisospora suis]